MPRWLMKAEPQSRIVKGVDVKFSVDDFQVQGKTSWEGVRNHEAKNIMLSMKVSDQVLFYHSNCKSPGIAGFAEVSREAYPDHSAWDSEHPYYDPKTDREHPKWFMVDLQFKSRAEHYVPLALLRRIASISSSPASSKSSSEHEVTSLDDVSYIGLAGLEAIKSMALVNRGRLSVQPVEDKAWETICLLAERGGWEGDGGDVKKGKRGKSPDGVGGNEVNKAQRKMASRGRGAHGRARSNRSGTRQEVKGDQDRKETTVTIEDELAPPKNRGRKRKAPEDNEGRLAASQTDVRESDLPVRRSTRATKSTL